MTIYVKKIEYKSPEHDELFDFRNRILYRPWNLDLDFETYYSDLGCNLYGLYNKDSLIGSVQTRKNLDGTAIIKDLSIHHKYRGQGLGTGLLKFAESRFDDEDLKTIHLETYRSSLNFFLKNGYKEKEKHKALNKMLVLDLEKPYDEREKSGGLPLYQPNQKKPLGLILHESERYDFLPRIRQIFPQENLVLIELPSLSKKWLDFAHSLCLETFKVGLFSPMVEAYASNLPINTLHLSKSLVQETSKITDSKFVLLMANSEILSSKTYEEAFKDSDSPISLVQVSMDIGSQRTDINLKSNFYSEILKKIEDLREENFDTLLLPDFNLLSLSAEIKDYLELNLNRKLKFVDLSRAYLASLRRQLIEDNLSTHTGEVGYLKIYSQYPTRAKDKLIHSHPSEKSTDIEKILP